jgi:hypothetical protein
MPDRPCLCHPDYRCTKHYRIDPRLEVMAKNFAITDATWLRWLDATDAGIESGMDALTEHMNNLLNELGPPPGWTPDKTGEGCEP